MKRTSFARSSSFLVLAVCLLSLSVHAAESDENFFEGKTIRLIAASSPGGGTDSLARLQARHFGKHIPGNPRVIVVNMPGAGGMIGANYLYNRASKDGLAMGTINTGLVYRVAMGGRGAKFELDKFTFLGQIAQGGQVLYFRSDTPFTSFDAIKKADRKPKVGAQSRAHNSNVVPRVISEVFDGADLDVVSGYPGTAEILLDIERGALDGRVQSIGSILSTRGDWIKEGFVTPLAVTTPKRDSRLPDTPTLGELAPPEKSQLLDGLYVVQGRWIALPPDIPAERAKILRDGFMDMLKDEEFLKEAEQLGWAIDPMRGEELNEKVANAVNNKEIMDMFRRILNAQ